MPLAVRAVSGAKVGVVNQNEGKCFNCLLIHEVDALRTYFFDGSLGLYCQPCYEAILKHEEDVRERFRQARIAFESLPKWTPPPPVARTPTPKPPRPKTSRRKPKPTEPPLQQASFNRLDETYKCSHCDGMYLLKRMTAVLAPLVPQGHFCDNCYEVWVHPYNPDMPEGKWRHVWKDDLGQVFIPWQKPHWIDALYARGFDMQSCDKEQNVRLRRHMHSAFRGSRNERTGLSHGMTRRLRLSALIEFISRTLDFYDRVAFAYLMVGLGICY